MKKFTFWKGKIKTININAKTEKVEKEINPFLKHKKH